MSIGHSEHLAQSDCPAVTELTGPIPKLVTAVTHSVRVAARNDGISGHRPHERLVVVDVVVKPQHLEHLRGDSDQRWRLCGSRHDP